MLIVDLAVVLFLLSKNRHIGAILALIVMLADVSINTYAVVVMTDILIWKIVLQAIFLGFILGSIGFLKQYDRG